MHDAEAELVAAVGGGGTVDRRLIGELERVGQSEGEESGDESEDGSEEDESLEGEEEWGADGLSGLISEDVSQGGVRRGGKRLRGPPLPPVAVGHLLRLQVLLLQRLGQHEEALRVLALR